MPPYSTALQQKTSINWCFSSSPNRKIVCNQTTSHALSINFLFVWRMCCTSADRTIRVLISIFKHKRHESRALYPISGPSESGGNSPYLRILAELEAKTATCQLWFDAIRKDSRLESKFTSWSWRKLDKILHWMKVDFSEDVDQVHVIASIVSSNETWQQLKN